MNTAIRRIDYDYTDGISTCIIVTKDGRTAIGSAYCHPNDYDVASEFTGCHIAFLRACIEDLRYQRDVIMQQIQSLKDYYYTINQKDDFNEDAYEIRMLKRRIKYLENRLEQIRDDINGTQESLTTYIQVKHEYAEKYRKRLADKNS